MKTSTFTLVITAILSLSIGFILATVIIKSESPKIELPEEWQQITPDDLLRGQIDSKGVLHLHFDNSVYFEWEGLEKDIPENGELIQISGTDENTVYLAPIDK